eukprot:1622432-Rhodomonas_salina.1
MMFVCLYSVGDNPRSNVKNSLSEDSTTTKMLSALWLGGGEKPWYSHRPRGKSCRGARCSTLLFYLEQ